MKALPIVLAALFVLACQSGQPEEPTEQSAEPQDETVLVTPGQLERAGLTFGLPHPEGLELVERSDSMARFGTDHSLDMLVEFYRRELPRHDGLVDDQLAQFRPERDREAEVFISPGTLFGWEVSYFRRRVNQRVNNQVNQLQPQLQRAAAAEPGQSPTRQRRVGPVAPEGWRPSDADRTAAQSDTDLYDERVEEIDGQEVRTLVPRRDWSRGGRYRENIPPERRLRGVLH